MLTALLTLAATACATTDDSTIQARRFSSDCFMARTLRGWRPLDNQHLIFFANGRRPHLVELARPVFGLENDMMVGVYDRDGRICPYGGDSIVINDPIRERVQITSIRSLTEDELDAVFIEYGVTAPASVQVEAIEIVEEEEPD